MSYEINIITIGSMAGHNARHLLRARTLPEAVKAAREQINEAFIEAEIYSASSQVQKYLAFVKRDSSVWMTSRAVAQTYDRQNAKLGVPHYV